MPLPYSEDLKWRIIYLHYDCLSKDKIATTLRVSKSLVNKVLRIYKNWGAVTHPWRKVPGVRKTFDRNDMNVCIHSF